MPKDQLSHYRKKNKLIFEIKYNPIAETADRRGNTISKLQTKFKNKMQEWKMQNVGIIVLDDLKNTNKQIFIDHMRSYIHYEDVSTLQEFYDDTKRFLEVLFDLFKGQIKEIKQIKIDFASIFISKEFKNFQDVFNRIMVTFYNQKIPLSIKPNDCRFELEHDFGNIFIGPIKKDENFIKDTFNCLYTNIPDFGFFVGLNNQIVDLKEITLKDVIEAFDKLFNLTQNIESEIVNGIIEVMK